MALETTITTETDETTGAQYTVVRAWDVYSQSWGVWPAGGVPDRVLASLSEDERELIRAAAQSEA